MMRGFGFMGIWGWAGMILYAVIFLVLLVGLIWLIVTAIRRGGGSQPSQMVSAPPAAQPPAGPTPREIAQARYARGEINREEFQQIIKDIEG